MAPSVEDLLILLMNTPNFRSQNDSLKAEIEAQIAAHKAQIAAAENRAHESWLSARQAERRIEEARSEATALRRKLTSIVGNANGIDNNLQNRMHESFENQACSPTFKIISFSRPQFPGRISQ